MSASLPPCALRPPRRAPMLLAVLLTAAPTVPAVSAPNRQAAAPLDLAAPGATEPRVLNHHRPVEIRTNTFLRGRQDQSTIAVDSGGNILTVWASRRQEAGTYGVFAQRLDPLGRPLGTELHVNQHLPSTQDEPAVDFAADGTAWIVWRSFAQDGDQSGIYLRRFGVAGGHFGPLGDEVRVNLTTTGDQFQPAVRTTGHGGALIAWVSVHGKKEPGIIARHFRPDGTPAGGEWDVSGSAGAGRDHLPTVARIGGDDLMITWAHTTAADQPASILARALAPAVGPRGAPFIVSDASDRREQIEPSLASDSSGSLVCAWMRSRSTGSGYDVVARRLSPTADLLGEVFTVAEHPTHWFSGAAVARAPDGRFAVSYNVAGDKELAPGAHRPTESSTVYARLYDSAGKPQGGPFRVNQDPTGRHAHAPASNAARSAWSAKDQLAFIWNGHAEDDASASGLTLFAPKSLRAPEPPPVIPLAATPSDGLELATAPHFDRNSIAPRRPRDSEPDVGAGPDPGFMGFESTGWQPPDPDIAAGTQHIVSVVNMSMRIHTKAGSLLFDQTFEEFFAQESGGEFLFDPVALYDPHAGRFVVVTADRQGVSQDGLNVAISKTGDPTKGWHKYYIQTDHLGDSIDFENLGVGPNAYYITADYFTGWHNQIHILEKAPMLRGEPVELRHHRTASTLLSLAAVKSYDPNPPAQYFATSWPSPTHIRIYAVRDPLGSIDVDHYDLAVDFMSSPPDATQKGSSRRVSTIDPRIKNGIYRNGSLWLAHTVAVENTAAVRWYEVSMNGWPGSGVNPALSQAGTLDYGSGEHNWFPDISVSEDGDAVITCSRSSADDYPYVARAGRKASDAPGTFRQSVRLKDSEGPTTSDRWGDYSGNDEDPADPGVVWSHTIYNTTGPNWRTWVGRVDTDQLMDLENAPPLSRGQRATITARSAASRGRVFVAYSFAGPGQTDVPELNATLDLAEATLFGWARADGQGTFEFEERIPGNAPTGTVYLQLIESNNTSNVIRATIR